SFTIIFDIARFSASSTFAARRKTSMSSTSSMVTMGKPTHRETNSQLTHFLFRKLSAQIGCKLSCLKSLAKQAQARAIKVQHLRSLATLTHKHKQIASRDIALHRSFDKSFLQIETTSSRLKPTTHVPAGPFIESEPPSCVGRSLT